MIQIFSKLLSDDAIDTSPEWVKYNVTEYQTGEIQGILKPKTSEEVRAIVKLAADENISLYPFSSGKNWGQGSKLPVKTPAILVDLSGLKKIHVDQAYEFAIIEAGVTQGELASHLIDQNIPLKFPVTGSAKATSITGNMLERGVSAFFHRRTRLLGIEAVLSNGQLLRTGHWHSHQLENQPIFYAPGLGPDLTQAFCQSNFGIVTSIAIKLIPKDHGTLVFAETSEHHLKKVVDLLATLKKQHLIGEGVLVTNKNDPRTAKKKAYNYSGQWSIVTSFQGVDEVRAIIRTKVEDALKVFCQSISFVDSHSTCHLEHPYQTILRDLYNGVPSDYSLLTMAQLHDMTIASDEEVDQNSGFPGMSVALMAVAFKGEQVWKTIRAVRKVSETFNLHAFYNFATLDDHTFEGFFRVYFDRNSSEVTHQAHLWSKEVHKTLKAIGVFPYRLNLQEMQNNAFNKEDTFWQTIGQLKKTLDPQNILAHGRYAPH